MLNNTSSRPFLLLSSAFFFLVLFIGLFGTHSQSGFFTFLDLQKPVGFHYIVPTTNTGTEVCKLLFSGAVLGYPEPVLLGWEGRGRWNGSEGHLFKISETFTYLTTLRKDQDDDLILLLDAFDVWLQLPPEIIIQRYFRSIEKSNSRLRKAGLLGKRSGEGVSIKNTILFGATKSCWPPGVGACQYAPKSPLPETLFGPNTDVEDVTIRPRYLNSGTILGPVKDVRDLFRATLEKIDFAFDENYLWRSSDQYYLNMLWDEQEEARLGIKNGSWVVTKEDDRTDYHLTLDYESDLFMVNNFYSQFVTWMSFNHSSHQQSKPTHNPSRLDRLSLPQDLLSIAGPYSAGNGKADGLPIHRGWQDVMLGTNTATGGVFPLYHITGEKLSRASWWPRMWFHPHGPELLQSARKRWLSGTNVQGEHVIAKVRDVEYIAVPAHKGDVFQTMRARDGSNRKGGAWNDLGEYMRWDEICGDHEKQVFVGG